MLLSDCLHALLQQQDRAIARDDLDADEQQQRVLCQKQIAELSDALESVKIVISSLDSHSEALRKDQHQHARLWIQKKYQHMLNIALSLGLITGSITVMCAYFPPLAVLPMMHLLGLSICFSAIVLHTAVEGELNTHHAAQSNRNIRAESELLLDKFNHTDYVPEKKLLYLEMQRLHAQSDHQQAMISYQQMRVLHTLCLQVMCPALIFASFLVMPAASFVLLSLIFLLSVLSTQYLARYEPKIMVDLRFRDDLFEKFVAQPSFGTLKKQLDMQRNQPVSAVMPAASDTKQTDQLTDEPSDEAHDSEAGMV